MAVSRNEIFLRVAEKGSLTRAAEALGCTQSNVSHAINALEEEFGFPLFSRGRGGAKLTQEGERILPFVRQVVLSEENLRRTVDTLRGLDGGTIRVGAFSSVSVHWLPGIIKNFQSQYPGIEFKLLSGDYYDVDQWLGDGSVDIAFITLPTELDCHTIPLCEDRLLAVLPPESEKALGRASLPVGLVEGEPFISLLEGSDQDARRVLQAAGIQPNIKFTTKDDYAIIAMVANGLGMSIMPELLLEGRAEKVCVMELDPPASRTIALAIPQANLKSPATMQFAEFVKQWVQTAPRI
jgi:DNA-binding transcriptional LysR family regulator